MENKIQHPTKSDYIRIKEFTDSICRVSSTFSKLNNHFEVLKRVGDPVALTEFFNQLSRFEINVIDSYMSKLNEKNDEN